MGRIGVGLLGPLVVTCDGCAVTLSGAKRGGVLAMLALRASEPVPISALIDGIWGDDPPDDVRGSLQQHVRAWRQVLAPCGGDRLLTHRRGAYSLEIDPDDTDVVQFRRLLASARGFAGEARHRLAQQEFDAARSLWRGEALQGFEDMPFYLAAGVPLREEEMRMLAERIATLLASGQGPELVSELEGLVARHPLEERFRVQQMHALYRAGRQVDALRAYERARLALAEVGVEPGPALRAMEEAILRHDPELEVRTSPFVPASAPEPLTTLIGREEDLPEAVAIAARGPDRLVTLTGPGGVGKTRMAVEVARKVDAEAWLPVAYVALSEVADPGVVSASVNGAFGVPDSWKERPVAEIARLLGDAPLLVVIDGAEHLVDPVRSVVRDLLTHGRQLRVLLTSRASIGLPGERQLPVRPLAARVPPGSGADPRTAPAVALFIDRCERQGQNSTYTDAEVTAIAEICEKVDGLPLAIELAAARTGALGVMGLRHRLGSRLDLLARPHDGGDRRHESLRAVIEWSYGLLSSHAQTLLARFSVFAGGFNVIHAEEMWPDERPGSQLASLEELDRNSLLARIPGTTPPRFRLLDTVRDFARERLEAAGELQDAHDRLVRWIRRQIASVGGRVGGGAVQFEQLEHDADNARVAIAWSLDHDPVDEAAAFCNELYVWWTACARGSEIGRWLEEALRQEIGDGRIRAEAHLALGRIYGRADDVAASDRHLMEALSYMRRTSDGDGIVHALSSMVENAVHQGRFAEAEPMVAEAVALAEFSSSPEVLCRSLHAACWLAGSRGEMERARGLGEELASLAAAHGLTEFEAKTVADLAWIERGLGNNHRALTRAGEAYELALRCGSGGAVVSALTESVLALLLEGRSELALRAAYDALIYESGDDLSVSSVLRLAAPVMLIAGHLQLNQLSEVAEAVIEATISGRISASVWPADEAVVGPLVACIRSRLKHRNSTEVDVIRVARRLAAAIAAEIGLES